MRRFTWRLIIVDVYSLELQVAVTLVATSRVDAVFVTYNFPELNVI